MATEMAMIPATQNPTAATAPKTSAKAPAKPRASRAKASACEAKDAKSPRAKSPRAAAKSKQAQATSEVMDASSTSIEQALLEKESSKSLAASPKPVCKAHCGQCGREMRFVPFSLSNLMCRSCYGLDRYRRPVAPTVPSAAPSNTSR